MGGEVWAGGRLVSPSLRFTRLAVLSPDFQRFTLENTERMEGAASDKEKPKKLSLSTDFLR